MGYREVEEIALIRQYDKQLRAALTKQGSLYEERKIGYPSGHTTKKVNFLSEGPGAIWHCSWKKESEVVNLFGRGEYGAKQTLLIDLQFNYALNKIKKSLGGAFLEDTDTGKISLAHRGIITVINRIPKDIVFEAMASHAIDAQPGQKPTELLLITDLNSTSLLRDMGEFSIELRDSVRDSEENEKASTNSNSLPTGEGRLPNKTGFDKLKEYFKEFTGKRKSYKPKQVYTKSNHGKIVEALHKEFLGKNRVLKSREIDLVVDKKKHTLLFEVKTSADTQSIYTAIGQLSIHASPTRQFTGKPVAQVIVLPEYPMEHIVDVIADELNFRLVTYSIDTQGAVSFQDLHRL
ncbi:hypothetical protein QM312_29770 [Burkholderia cenocepacia]|uniref:hypothetical protein n=1 Tax=Burkholderia cenocepacia TaxID=95486 RepID=UPI0024B84DCE|nr:hypothetical protein [Burkholderia cenocepacia]MDI9700134.1 hypothetical protein [Burkholderia cenocepacia]